MAKLNYIFNLPIPKYFWDHDWFKPEPNGNHFKRLYFMTWCFNRCSHVRRVVFFSGKEVILDPFEFIFGRSTCSKETGLSEQEIRTLINQQNLGVNGPTLEKSTSKSTNKYSVYKFVTRHFIQIDNQQNNQPSTSNQPATNHNLDSKILEFKKTTTPTSSNDKVVVVSLETQDSLKRMKVSNKKIEELSQYGESRVLKAIDYCKKAIIRTTILQTLFWHCQQEEPPIPPEKSISPEKQEAFKYFEFLIDWKIKLPHPDFDKTMDEKKYFHCFLGGNWTTVSLKASLNEIKNDIAQSMKEITEMKKRRKGSNE